METRFSSGRVTGGTKTSAAHVQWIRLLLAGDTNVEQAGQSFAL